MAISYPLSIPTGIAPIAYNLGYKASVISYSSPFTFQTHVYKGVGYAYSLSLDFGLIKSDRRNEMEAFLMALNGVYGTFKWYPKNPTKNVVSNKTISAHNTLRDTLTLNNVTSITVGDFLRVGTQLVKVVNISGNAIDIRPPLREDSVNATVYGSDVYGVFRLSGNDQKPGPVDVNWNQAFAMECVEAV